MKLISIIPARGGSKSLPRNNLAEFLGEPLINKTIEGWPGTNICQKKYLKSPHWLRDIKIKKRALWKIYKPQQPQIIKNGGWHFNDLKKPEDISKKLLKLKLVKEIK